MHKVRGRDKKRILGTSSCKEAERIPRATLIEIGGGLKVQCCANPKEQEKECPQYQILQKALITWDSLD